jgi:hypothetical protein
MSPPESLTRPPTHEEIAADVVDAATTVDPPLPAHRLAARAFWWLAHHAVARPLVLAFPVRRMLRFSAWTLGRRNM